MSEPDASSDERLVAAIRGGDMAAFDALYRRWAARLWAYVRRSSVDEVAAEDLFQEVFFTVLADRSFDPARGDFAGWLFTVARNRCRDLHRQERRRPRDARGPEPSVEPEIGAEALLRAAAVRAAVAELSESQRDVLLLKQVEGRTYREIAEIQGIPEGTVKSRVANAVQAFRKLVHGDTP